MSRILTVDIGNSNIVAGIWNSEALEFTGRIVTKRDYTCDDLVKELSPFCDSTSGYDGSILASVVPEITDQTADALDKITGKRPLIMGPFLNTGIDLSSYNGGIGMDRIVDMAAAVSMYGAPVMVCDLGTCTTVTVADTCDGEYKGRIVGGIICPGVQLSLDAEAAGTSQLPQLRACEADCLLGTDTASNMISGAVAGTGLMISQLAGRLRDGDMASSVRSISEDKTADAAASFNRAMPHLKVVLTGGLGRFVLPWTRSGASSDMEIHYDPDLLLRGLREIFYLNQ